MEDFLAIGDGIEVVQGRVEKDHEVVILPTGSYRLHDLIEIQIAKEIGFVGVCLCRITGLVEQYAVKAHLKTPFMEQADLIEQAFQASAALAADDKEDE